MGSAFGHPVVRGLVTGAKADLRELSRIAAATLTEFEGQFVAALGSRAVVHKGPGDFATEADLVIERQLSELLLRRTGIAVHGEEHGGPSPAENSVWVLDPVDGTANYSRGLPLTGINLGLLIDGVPRVGLTWLPLLDERYLAVDGDAAQLNGVRLPPLARLKLDEVMVGFGNPVHQGPEPASFPTEYRLLLLAALARRCLRIRVFGSSSVDLAWVASGRLGAVLLLGNNPWDVVAGACLVRAAGGLMSDLGGAEYSLGSQAVLAAAPGVHEAVLEVIAELGDKE